MMIGSSRNYAIGMAHFEMGGGWKSLVSVCVAYLLLVLTVVGLVYYSEMSGPPMARKGITDAAVTLVVVMETISLVVFGGFRVSGAIRGDLSSQMIESHRLMPVESWRAVTGYLFGPTTQTLGFAFLNLVLAYVFAEIAGVEMERVTMGQATLFAFALLVWSACAVGTFVARYLVFVALGLAMPGACFLYSVYVGLPAVSLMTSPLAGQSIFVFTRGVTGNPWVYTASFVMQGAFFALFFAGACRRYRGSYKTTFSWWQALLLVVLWSGATAWALSLGNDVRLQGMFGRVREEDYHVPQIICSLIAGMLIALVPLRTLVVLQRGKRRSVMAVAGMVAGIFVALSAMPVGAKALHEVPWWNLVYTATGVGAFVVTAYGLMYLTRNFRPWMAALIVGATLLLMWCVPLFMEVVRAIYLSNHGREGEVNVGFGVFGNFSAVGMLINVWGNEETLVSPVMGLVGQWVVAAGVGVWAVFRRERVGMTNDEIRMTNQIPMTNV